MTSLRPVLGVNVSASNISARCCCVMVLACFFIATESTQSIAAEVLNKKISIGSGVDYKSDSDTVKTKGNYLITSNISASDNGDKKGFTASGSWPANGTPAAKNTIGAVAPAYVGKLPKDKFTPATAATSSGADYEEVGQTTASNNTTAYARGGAQILANGKTHFDVGVASFGTVFTGPKGSAKSVVTDPTSISWSDTATHQIEAQLTLESGSFIGASDATNGVASYKIVSSFAVRPVSIASTAAVADTVPAAIPDTLYAITLQVGQDPIVQLGKGVFLANGLSGTAGEDYIEGILNQYWSGDDTFFSLPTDLDFSFFYVANTGGPGAFTASVDVSANAEITSVSEPPTISLLALMAILAGISQRLKWCRCGRIERAAARYDVTGTISEGSAFGENPVVLAADVALQAGHEVDFAVGFGANGNFFRHAGLGR